MHMNKICALLAKQGVDVSNIKTASEAVAKLQETFENKDSKINQLSERPTAVRILANGKKPKQTGTDLPPQCRVALDKLRQFAFDLEYQDPESPAGMDRIDKGTKAAMKRDGISYRAALEKLAAEKPSFFQELEPTSPVEIFRDLVADYTERFKGNLDARIERFSQTNDPNEALELATEEYMQDSVGAEKFLGLTHRPLAELAQIAECDWSGFINACKGAWAADVEGEAFAERIVERYNRSRLAEEREQDAIYKQYLKERGI